MEQTLDDNPINNNTSDKDIINTLTIDEESEEEKIELLLTENSEMNQITAKDNDYLLIGIYGNGSAYLKSSLFQEIIRGNQTLKQKFFSRDKDSKDKKPKKTIAELYQFEGKNNTNHLVLLTKENISNQNYNKILEIIKSLTTFKRVVILDSIHKSGFLFTNSDKNNFQENSEHFKAEVFCMKNSAQLNMNQLIKVENIPYPNTVSGLPGFIISYCEFNNIPCVCYLLVTDIYEVCLDSLKQFSKINVSYEFLREKLSEGYLKDNGITTQNLNLKEYNSYKVNYYT